ncbi:MAG: methylenetetrahydrofolate reductase [NAD(P)H] [Chloroflexota bacterium]|nr:methylenetetrahydrofolate reductase [NAD(P)H] [Chloroflexota bacterium]
MKFSDFYGKDYPIISFELFPPRTEKMLVELEERLPKLISLGPSFITVTYGALGSTQERTLDIASRIKNEYGMETAHHLTCVGASRDQITATLDTIRQHKIENIVALRGDPAQGDIMFTAPENGYDHGNQLVEHIRAFGDFGIGVAGYPEKHIEAPDEATDLKNLKRKVDSGADVVITQLYYDNRHFYHFVEQCRAVGIHKPIVPGLMPILSVEQIKRITGLCGATIPIQLLRQLENAGNDEKRVQEIGIVHTANQALELLDHGVPGIHFYVLNRHFHIAEIMERIKHALP